MTLGQKLRKLRIQKGLTQKDLADHLHVTFQTISKWESDINEPDFSTIKELCKFLGCSIEYLFNDGEVKKEAARQVMVVPSVPARKKVGICRNCGQPIYQGDLIHNVQIKSTSGVKEIVTVCDTCFRRHEEAVNKRIRDLEDSMKSEGSNNKNGKGRFHRITDRKDKRPLIWGIVFGLLFFIAMLIVFIINADIVGIGWVIAAPILIGYTVMATIYCIFSMSYISDVFLDIFSWTFRFPGLIFSFSMEGIMWLIGMKLLFFVLGILISICTFFLSIALSAFLSFFSFIPILIYNKTHY